MLQN
jgi:hypothetical protein